MAKTTPYPPCTGTALWPTGTALWRCLRRVTQPPHIAGPLYLSLCTKFTLSNQLYPILKQINMRTLDFRNALLNAIVALTILLTACKNNNDSNGPKNVNGSRLTNKDLIIIDLDTTKQSLANYSEFFSSAQFIPLETSDKSLIGYIGQLELFNDTVYILDSRTAKCIFVFTLTGKFVRKIGVIGKGPGEWIQPSNFCINKTQRLLYVLDAQLQRITLLHLDGEVIKQISLKNNSVRSQHIECDNGRIFLDARHFSNNDNRDDYMVREIDSTGIEINKWFSLDKDNKGWTQSFNISGSGTFYSSPSNIKFVELFMDTIYSITNEGMLPFIAIKSSEILDREPISEIQSAAKEGGLFTRKLFEKDEIWAINSYIENDDIIYFIFYGNRVGNLIIINKRTNQIRYLKGLFNDITFEDIKSGTAMPNFYTGENNLIVGAIQNAKQFQESIKKNITNLTVEEKEKFLKVSEFDNPILIILNSKSGLN
jgi:hypothetical protein